MTKSKTLKTLFVKKIQSLYDVETQLVEALPKMAEAATDPDLKQAFKDHLEETEFQVKRLEDIFDLLEEDKEILETEAIRGLVADGEWLVKNVEEGDVLDAALIGAARAVEHYEMSCYTGAQEWAEILGHSEAATLLEETREEEEASEEKLADLATLTGERLENEEEEEE